MKKLFLIVSASLLIASSLAQAGLYRWVDEKGEVHFSDKVPVKATKKAVSQINKHGDVTKTVDPEAQAKAKREFEENTAEREKQEAIEKKRQAELAVLKKRDNYLLSTYENKNELVTSFETKIKLMKGNAAILDAQNAVLKKKLSNLLVQRKATKQQSKKDSLKKKIVSIATTIKQYKKALQQNKDERVHLSNNYQSDIKRYSELTN